MTAKTSRELAILGVLVVVLGGVLYWNLSGTSTPTATAPQPSSNSSTPAKGKTVKADAVVIDVKLDRLARAGDTYGAAARDPFRFRPKATPVVARQAPPPATGPFRIDLHAFESSSRLALNIVCARPFA